MSIQPLAPSKLLQADSERLVWSVFVTAGMKFEDVLKDEYWAHVAERLHLYDEIIAIEESGAWRGVALVTNKVGRLVHLQQIAYNELSEVKANDEELPEGYELSWSPRLRWSVIQKETHERVSQGHANREEAAAWARDNVKK